MVADTHDVSVLLEGETETILFEKSQLSFEGGFCVITSQVLVKDFAKNSSGEKLPLSQRKTTQVKAFPSHRVAEVTLIPLSVVWES